ncbi:MAG: hypothetical protein U9N76_01160 [Candidatus Marinimicrobia bacterium]|nr:hypothetical protein [Candidatus Neomarinimicrobiota bacterium]
MSVANKVKKTLVILFIVLLLIISCKKEQNKRIEIKREIYITGSDTIITTKEVYIVNDSDTILMKQGTKTAVTDSTKQNKENFREHKSIHQIEWEEHQKDTISKK